jgi:prepilin-type N-terminal cleavage/methylation domain-containing protein
MRHDPHDPAAATRPLHFPAAGFTLIELVVVIAILAILSALTLRGLAVGNQSAKRDSTRFMIQKLNDAIMDQYETYEDLADNTSAYSLLQLRARMREELPDAWADVADNGTPHPASPAQNVSVPLYATGRRYRDYKAARPQANIEYQGAECLYMIITQGGRFNDFLESISSDRIGDVDDDGAKEFLDGWRQPIEFLRWAPGFSEIDQSLQVPDPISHHDPLDVRYEPSTPPPAGCDPNAYALFPLIYSAGPGGLDSYGILVSRLGWPNASGSTPSSLLSVCTFTPDPLNPTVRVGAENPANRGACRDNITNHQLMTR